MCSRLADDASPPGKKPGMAHGVSPRTDDVKLDGKEDEDGEVFHDMEQDDTTEGAGGAAEEKKAKSTSANAEVPSPAPGAFTSMETESDGGEEKKLDAIKHSKAGMVADDGMKEDGAEAVPEGVKDAAAHAAAAEGVPQPVPDELHPDAEDEMAGWTFVSRKKNGADWHRVSLMVKGGSEQEADKLAKFLFNCATHATMRRLPNAANNEDGRQVHRYSYVELKLGGKQRKLLNWGMEASDQHGWVAAPPESDFSGLEYRVDKAKEPSKARGHW